MKKAIIFIVATLFYSCAYTQKQDLKTKLYKLEDKIIAGDMEALREIAKYLDDKIFVQEFLGYHNYPNTARGVAMRVIEENCLFTDDEFKIDSAITSAKFSSLLNSGKLKFDEITGMFLITELKDRKTEYVLKELSKTDIDRIGISLIKPRYPDWYYENQVDAFLLSKNPEVLKWIASAWFQKRSRFNRYYFNDEEFIDLMKKLTNVDLGGPDEKGKITFLYKDDYYAKARLNYLIYWTNHCADYKWNSQKGYYENIKESSAKKGREEILFPFLKADNDSVAIKAFLELAESDTGLVRKIADDYEKGGRYDRNSSLPFYAYSFLRQMTHLTLYCRNNEILYKANGWLKDSLEKLKKWELSFPERYSLENYIIKNISPATITMVEYFGLVNEANWSSTYSTGRIVDKYYSKRWEEIIADEKNILLFLKKAELFSKISIGGNNRKYRRKFENCSQDIYDNINVIFKSTTDPNIRNSAKEVLDRYLPSAKRQDEVLAAYASKTKFGAPNLQQAYKDILKKYTKKEDRTWPIKQLFAQINYSQLGEAVQILIADTNWGEYDDPLWVVRNDFGIDINPKSDSSVNKFIELHKSKSEFEVYSYYLNEKSLDCFDAKGEFIFDKVYDILKFDVVDAFVGGGGSRRNDGVYPLIRLLELKFNNRLGFPEKLCDSKGVYSCNCIDRSRIWMKYLEEKGILNVDKTEPCSISYND